NGHLVKTTDGQYLPGGLRPPKRLLAQNAVEPASEGTRDAAVLEFLRGTRELVAAQREVMLGYLGAPTRAPETLAAAVLPPAASQTVVAGQVLEPDPAEVIKQGDLTPGAVMATVRALVSEKTGYPVDMLEADLDLEADLSIDSIKRTELIG